MSPETIGKIVAIAVYGLVGAIISIISFFRGLKHKKEAKDAKEEQAGYQQMLDACNEYIANAETFYKNLDTVLKQQNMGTAGAYKKESVMNKLQQFAKGLNYNFDEKYWSEKIDELVKLTKDVNIK